MNRTKPLSNQPGAARRPGGARQLLGALLAATAMLAAMPAARATSIDFENTGMMLVGNGDSYLQDNYLMTGIDTAGTAGNGALVGAIIDGSDSQACGNLACPANNISNYYAALNDGALFIETTVAGGTFQIKGFDASFIGALAGGSYPATAGLLRIEGIFADFSYVLETYALAGPVGGVFSFQHFDTSPDFATQNFIGAAFFGFSCATSSCNAVGTDKAQFALDNVLVTSVPEPSTWMMLLLGLAALLASSRRPAARQTHSGE